MNFEQLENDTVRQALEALNDGNGQQFEQALAIGAELIHNGEPDNIREWARLFFFEGKTQFLTINRVEDKRRSIWAELDSPIAGKIEVKLVFTVSDGKIVLLNAGRP